MNNPYFPEIHGRFGFGCMRLPERDGEIDFPVFEQMIDAFLDAGLNYFDTAHGYHSGRSELALGKCLAARYPREKFLLTNKLTDPYFQSQADIRPFFQQQLKDCGVDYFDFYLMHAQNAVNFEKFRACRAYETAFELKKEGLIRHVGLSFHDQASVLDHILTTYPEVEIVQIQFNYLDYENPAVDSKGVFEVCRKHGKPVIVMEPVKGGTLVNLPQPCLDEIAARGLSPAELALRFAAGFEGMAMVLSGMSNPAQMADNLRAMTEPKPLDEAELALIGQVREAFNALRLIPCTGCRYCVDGCPMGILIPDLFAAMNRVKQFGDWSQRGYYHKVLTQGHGLASECVKCGACEGICPQGLEIRDLLEQVAAEFEAARRDD